MQSPPLLQVKSFSPAPSSYTLPIFLRLAPIFQRKNPFHFLSFKTAGLVLRNQQLPQYFQLFQPVTLGTTVILFWEPQLGEVSVCLFQASSPPFSILSNLWFGLSKVMFKDASLFWHCNSAHLSLISFLSLFHRRCCTTACFLGTAVFLISSLSSSFFFPP